MYIFLLGLTFPLSAVDTIRALRVHDADNSRSVHAQRGIELVATAQPIAEVGCLLAKNTQHVDTATISVGGSSVKKLTTELSRHTSGQGLLVTPKIL